MPFKPRAARPTPSKSSAVAPASAPVRRRDLRALRDKYTRMLALREAHLRAQTDASFVEPDPRTAMAELAAEFPGALREMDTLPLDVIGARVVALVRCEARPSTADPWMRAQVLFHRLARGALVTKRWLAGRDHTPAIQHAFAKALVRLPRGDDAVLFQDDLERVSQPPRGRVMDLVHARVAEALGVTDDEARALVFGPTRPRRAR